MQMSSDIAFFPIEMAARAFFTADLCEDERVVLKLISGSFYAVVCLKFF